MNRPMPIGVEDFGKTLALSMLKYYFEDAYDWNGNHIEHSGLFADKAIEKEDVRYRRHMGKYPVIFLTLKSGGQDVFPEAYWVNTSSNSIVRDLITHADEEQKQAVESLIAGDSIRIPVHEDITYDEIYKMQKISGILCSLPDI